MRPSLHLLRVFETVARHRSFTRAAAELHSTQPTVSVQMRELAAAVGLPLVEQRGRTLALTEAGAALLATARRMFDAWSAFEMQVAELQGARRGRLRLAAVTTAEYFVPELLAPFARAHPGVEVQLAVENRDTVVRRLEDDLDDLAVMMMPPAHLPLVATPFLENPLVAFAHAAHPLAARRRIALAAFAAEPLLTREKGSGTRMAVEQFFAQHGLAPNVRMELGSNEAIKHAVAAGLGCAILSRHTLGRNPHREGLVLLTVEHLPIRRTWYLVQRAGRSASPVVRAFVEDVERRLAARAGAAALGPLSAAAARPAAARRAPAARSSGSAAPAARTRRR